ncbi:glycoside hydrolase [Aureobasidium subglaciale]|nr:glycoside hydrolase [Aureobasidium subglaciale]
MPGRILTLATGIFALLASSSTAIETNSTATYIDWRTFKANGVNLGGWLEQEQSMDQAWWFRHSNASDEWNFCKGLGYHCGPVLEERYATFITKADVDKFASVGVNLLRIPTTYAAWIDVPWSEMYSGNQQKYLRDIVDYAVDEYDMHIIIGLHSLPGGVNALDIGEAVGHVSWFNNQTNLNLSLQAVQGVLDFITSSRKPQSFTLAPINEAIDNAAGLGQSTSLTTNGSAWVTNYMNHVIPLVETTNPHISIMLQDSWKGEAFWSPFFPSTTNLVIDTHIYYNWKQTYSSNVTSQVCAQAKTTAGDGKFPVFVGEWAIETTFENQLDSRREIFETMRFAWRNYNISGSAFWLGRYEGNATVDGEGLQKDYWGYENLIDNGVIRGLDGAAVFC